MKNENKFQAETVKEIKERFPGAIVTKMDANYIQGIPDILVLYKNRWATLEFKRSESDYKKSLIRNPNQSYYVDRMSNMAYSSFIFPENKERVLDEMERSFETEGNSCGIQP
jgi:hypothetical protein